MLRPSETAGEENAWPDIDETIFENLRQLRREIAAERGVAAFVIFHDATLRELASRRPTTMEAIRHIRGMGEKKLLDFGARVIQCIKSHQ